MSEENKEEKKEVQHNILDDFFGMFSNFNPFFMFDGSEKETKEDKKD